MQVRRAQALDLGAARQQRRMDALRVELGQRRDARERAQARREAKRRELEGAQDEVRRQRERLDRLREQAFSCEAWLHGMRMLDLLNERGTEHARALDRLESALAAADEQIDETRRELAATQARLDLLRDKAAQLRARVQSRQLEADDETATEDAAARLQRREPSPC